MATVIAMRLPTASYLAVFLVIRRDERSNPVLDTADARHEAWFARSR